MSTPATPAVQLYAEARRRLNASTDRMVAVLLLTQWVGTIAWAVASTPLVMNGSHATVHPLVWTAVLLGGGIAVPVAVLALILPGRPAVRYFNALAQMLASSLLMHISGGETETHFHALGSLAILSFYRDWTVLMPALGLLIADHLVRGIYLPQSIYGVNHFDPMRFFQHTGWATFEVMFLTISCVRGQKEMRRIAEESAALQDAKQAPTPPVSPRANFWRT
ncbi:MAG: hypothetical protein QM754_02880 [Tepidisphaeraceae bacterium]